MTGNICIPVCAATAAELFDRLRAAAADADIVEVRFDCLDPGEITIAIENLPRIGARYLFTFRPKEQGGHRQISMAERVAFWSNVMDRVGDFLVDIEGDAPELLELTARLQDRIVSLHNFGGIWERPTEVFDRLAQPGSIVKMAAMVEDTHEAAGIWKALARATQNGRRSIPVAMGEAGQWTRILGLAHGAFLTFASGATATETAPGQVTAHELVNLYRAKELSKSTSVFGILGNPVSQSLSRFMHNPAFASVSFDGVFIPFLVRDIDAFMARMVRSETREVEVNFGGFSVTMPHKQSIMRHLDEIEPTAEKIGAVNTVKIDNGKLIGYNTDAHGFIAPLTSLYGELSEARVAVFGAGGAARACVFALGRNGANVQVFVRDPRKAAGLAEEFGVRLLPIGAFAARDFDIVVNATPVGMSGELAAKSLLTREELAGIRFVYDLVTKPSDTPLVTEAKAAGAVAIGGLEMLIAQGAKQFELWTGEKAPIDGMRKSVLKRFAQLTQ